MSKFAGRQHRRGTRPRKADLTIERILAWADAHHRRTGAWPKRTSGPIVEAPWDTWGIIDSSLSFGNRGLRGTGGPQSLARLLLERRGVRHHLALPKLRERDILAWADTHFRRTGRWPRSRGGPVFGAPGETWTAINVALIQGLRGLPGRQSLPQLLAQRRGVRNHRALPRLSERRILSWARAHQRATGQWPHQNSGPVAGAPGEVWRNIQAALLSGGRGLSGGSSIARLLGDRLGVRSRRRPPSLSIDQILAWADAHRKRTGEWPKAHSGQVHEAPHENWLAIDNALYQGLRGLSAGESLARLLNRRRGVRNVRQLPRLTIRNILAWADDHHRRTGRWPTQDDGDIVAAPGEKWRNVHASLVRGGRGLPAGSSLAQILADGRGTRNLKRLPPLSERRILAWADAHLRRTGEWPRHKSGPIAEAPGEKWVNVDAALRSGVRGLPGGSSLARLLSKKRGRRNLTRPPPLTLAQIVTWARAHRRRTGRWPSVSSGAIGGAPDENWRAVNAALTLGLRGLAGGSSLGKLFASLDRRRDRSLRARERAAST